MIYSESLMPAGYYMTASWFLETFGVDIEAGEPRPGCPRARSLLEAV